jgi:hypothetical protein
MEESGVDFFVALFWAHFVCTHTCVTTKHYTQRRFRTFLPFVSAPCLSFPRVFHYSIPRFPPKLTSHSACGICLPPCYNTPLRESSFTVCVCACVRACVSLSLCRSLARSRKSCLPTGELAGSSVVVIVVLCFCCEGGKDGEDCSR